MAFVTPVKAPEVKKSLLKSVLIKNTSKMVFNIIDVKVSVRELTRYAERYHTLPDQELNGVFELIASLNHTILANQWQGIDWIGLAIDEEERQQAIALIRRAIQHLRTIVTSAELANEAICVNILKIIDDFIALNTHAMRPMSDTSGSESSDSDKAPSR